MKDTNILFKMKNIRKELILTEARKATASDVEKYER